MITSYKIVGNAIVFNSDGVASEMYSLRNLTGVHITRTIIGMDGYGRDRFHVNFFFNSDDFVSIMYHTLEEAKSTLDNIAHVVGEL